MTRAAAVIAHDVRLQIRYGLYTVSVLMVVFWGAFLGSISRGVDLSPPMLIPPFVAVNMIITTFYFMAALLLFEKSEGVLPALVTTPLTATGYLLSKTLSLSLLATAETLLIVAVVFGARAISARLVIAALVLGIFYALAGFLAVVRFESINQFLMPSVPIVMLLIVPFLAHFEVVSHVAVAWHPVHVIFLRNDLAAAPLAAAWCLLAFWLARKEFQRYVVRA